MNAVTEIQLESSNITIEGLHFKIKVLEKEVKELKKKEDESKIEKMKKIMHNKVESKSLIILLMWSIFTFVSACFGSYYVIDSILDYLKFSTVTKIKVINEKQVPFPAVSICAYPSFNSSLNKMTIINRFNEIIFNETNLYFEEFESESLGKCFRFNSGRNIYNKSYHVLNSTIAGHKYGFKLDMKIPLLNKSDYSEIKMFIHNKSLQPLDVSSSRGYWLVTGSWNYFEVDRIFHHKLDKPYGECFKNVSLFNKNKTLIEGILKENRDYTQEDCFYLCSQLFALETSKCGCNSNLNEFTKNCIRRINSPYETEVQKCNTKYLTEFREKYQDEKCSDYCPLECDSISYLITPYSEQIPGSGNISEFIKNSYFSKFNNFEEVKSSFLGIRVYYNELKYTLISEEPKTEPFNFVSNIGGILSLFLGLTFISFIELFELIIELIFYLSKKC